VPSPLTCFGDADFVSRLLHGTPASELPIENPTVFELVANLHTAEALGIEGLVDCSGRRGDRMTRIVTRIVILLGLLVGASQASAQERGRVYRVSVIADGRAVHLSRSVVIPELAKRGFVEGRNLIVETRPMAGASIDALVSELSGFKPDAIIAIGSPGLAVARKATQTIPVVALGPDFVELGYAESLSRPKGNVTGVAIFTLQLNTKRVELLHEALPGARRLGVLMHSLNPLNDADRRGITALANQARVEVLFFEAARPQDYRTVFSAMRASGAEALAINSHPQFGREAAVLAALALEHGLPTMCQWREMAEEGCLASYGPNLTELYRRVADLTGRVLRGVSPADIPIEQPTRLELVVNAKVAKALGLELPPAFLTQADEVIE
jgi:putative ABC transport system substrate-binding protein